MIIKKSATLTEFIVGLIIVMIFFMALFNYISDSMNTYNIPFDNGGNYSESYTKMEEAQTEMDTFERNLETSINNVAEADSAFSVAINGLKGLGTILSSPIVFVTTATKVFSATIETITGIPTYITTLFIIGLTITLLLIIIAAMMGGNPKL